MCSAWPVRACICSASQAERGDFEPNAPYAPREIRLREEEFGWIGGILEEFVREKHCSG